MCIFGSSDPGGVYGVCLLRATGFGFRACAPSPASCLVQTVTPRFQTLNLHPTLALNLQTQNLCFETVMEPVPNPYSSP